MTRPSTLRIVGVIFSRADLQRAVRMRRPPDLFELRLDAWVAKIEELKGAIKHLKAPLIITARHPREGGVNELSGRARSALLRQFLPQARYLDLELRSAEKLAAVWEEARAERIRTIISVHDFSGTPGHARLDEIAGSARSLGADLLKIVTRIDTPAQMATLLEFFQRQRREIRIAVMGIGRLGRISRREFARRGSVLNYAHLGQPLNTAQLSLRQLRNSLASLPSS
jgi:3-dehydroquinate dehydratase-1